MVSLLYRKKHPSKSPNSAAGGRQEDKQTSLAINRRAERLSQNKRGQAEAWPLHLEPKHCKAKQFPLAGRNKVITKLNDGDNQESSHCWSKE
jgi:hypothetical protein